VEFALTEDQSLFVDTIRKYLERECPLTTVRAWHETELGFDRDEWRRRAELGWTSLLVPESAGGGSISGSGVLDAALVAEETGRLVAPGPFVPVNVVASAIARTGTDQQRAEHLGPLLAGETVATWAFAEAARPWVGEGVTMRARRSGDEWVLDGSKVLVQDAEAADVLLVTAVGADGLVQLLVPARTRGVTMRRRESLDLVRRFADVDFADVRVPAAALLGTRASTGGEVAHQRRLASVLHDAETVGAVNRVFELTIEYAMDRVAFGRPIGSYQALKHRFADMKSWLEACNATADASAAALQADAEHADEVVSTAKSYIADRSVAIVQDCIQIHGGIGVTWEHDLHLYLRRVTQNGILYGSARYHRGRIARLLEPSPA
jgi:alkylation response protein AidB-like acyl-CoA dehydrogenase